MTLQRLSLGRGKRLDQPTDSTGHREFAGGGALAFVRHGAASWKSFYRLERATLEGALALAGAGQGQALLVTTHGPRSFASARRAFSLIAATRSAGHRCCRSLRTILARARRWWVSLSEPPR